MAELYPTDAYLISTYTGSAQIGTTVLVGTDTGVLPWNKLFYRYDAAVGPIADLRVFDEGSLDIGVKSGKFWDGNTLITFAESTGNTLGDDKANIYIYLTADGTLVIDEYDSYPDASVSHLRLATVTTSSGDITAIVDNRNQNIWNNPGGAAKQVAANILCYEGDVLTYDDEVMLYD